MRKKFFPKVYPVTYGLAGFGSARRDMTGLGLHGLMTHEIIYQKCAFPLF